LMSPQKASDLMVESGILDRIKVDNFLLVLAGARPCSQTTLPAEMPGGGGMGSTIDDMVAPKMGALRSERDPRRKVAAIASLKKEMSRAYERVVMDSPPYRAHQRWVKALGLRSRYTDVRPTIQELYVFRDRSLGGKLKDLMKRREKLREKAYREASPDQTARVAYPEEFNAPWLNEIGALLGYPDCCVEAYARDRVRGVNVESRASKQLKAAEREGDLDPYVYFVGYFFPCSPRCEAARALGRSCQERLDELAPGFGRLYPSMVAANRERVLRQPELIAEYQAKARAFRGRPR
jgi:hypothetical protein